MLALALYGFFAGYALFLLGFALFMYYENQRFGDNQFTVKLLPPPRRLAAPALFREVVAQVPASRSGPPVADWTPVPARQAMPAAADLVSRSS